MLEEGRLAALAVVTGLVLAALALVYRLRVRRHARYEYSAPAAWARAGIYWCFCLLVAIASGALPAVLDSPVMAPSQLSDPLWWIATVLVTVFILGAYWGYWYRTTLRFGRPLAFFSQGFFGLAWGVTTGLFFLSFWQLALALGPGLPLWGTWLLAYAMISVWQALWMDMYWDVWVSPEHDTPASIRAKVPRTHIPNMTLCLAHFALFDNGWLFIAWQTIALLAASYGMRMPPPWFSGSTPAARQVPGLFGLPRAGGYIELNTHRS